MCPCLSLPNRMSGNSRLSQGCRTYSSSAQNGTRKNFLGPRHSLLSQFFLTSFARPPSEYCKEHVYIYTHYLTAYRLYMNYRCYQITLQWHIFTQIRSGAKCWLDIYRWGAGLAVAGRIRDIGQKVLESSFQTGSRSSHSYCHILLLITFLEEVFIRNLTIILYFN